MECEVRVICASCGETVAREPAPSAESSTAADACDRCGGPAWLAGRYALEAPIGHGSMGTTWRAVDREGRAVAIKEIPLHRAATPKARELVDREASVLKQLHHPGIPRYHEHFVAQTGRTRTLHLVQELVDGRTLEDEMAERRYTPGDVLAILRGVLDILAYLHALSPPVVHRDVKPGNLMRRAGASGAGDGLVLIDFGAVRDAVKGDLGGSTVAGTFGYMAPEQFAGDASPATDLYGVGALALALLAHREPRDLVDRRHAVRWELLPDVPGVVRHLVERLVDVDPRARPETAADALAWVEAAEIGLRLPGPPPTPPRWVPAPMAPMAPTQPVDVGALATRLRAAGLKTSAPLPPVTPPDDELAPLFRWGAPVLAVVMLAAVLAAWAGIGASDLAGLATASVALPVSEVRR